MKKLTIITIAMCICLLSHAQNPNWTLAPNYLDVQNSSPIFLPSSPYNPSTGQPQLSPTFAYQGSAATNLHAGYTDPWGDLMFFTVDENFYDHKGWLVESFRKYYDAPSPGNYTKRGHNERLIFPMGNSCSKYAII